MTFLESNKRGKYLDLTKETRKRHN